MFWQILRSRALPLIAVLGLLLALWARESRWRAVVAEAEAEAARAHAAALERVREVEAAWSAKLEQVEQEAKDEIEALDRVAADVAVERDGLRAALETHRRRAAAGSPAACAGTATGAAADLYAQLLGELEGLAAGFAGEADRRRIAGLACERAYDAIRGAGSSAP